MFTSVAQFVWKSGKKRSSFTQLIPVPLFIKCLCLFTEKLSPERVKLVMEHIWRMQEFCNSMLKLSPDSYEYAYLKAIVLFSPGAYISWLPKFK